MTDWKAWHASKNTSEPSHAGNNTIRIIGTDSWDIVEPKSQVNVTQENYVVLPDSTLKAEESRSIEAHIMGLNPKDSKNPWINEMWKDIFNCTVGPECERHHLNETDFQIDTKVNFVYEAVMTFSAAVELCFRQGKEQCLELIKETDKFYGEYLMKGMRK